jgi:hypothetical protein
METTVLEKEVIRHVLWYFGDERGWEPGGFTRLILAAMQKADPGNFLRLSVAFPQEAKAMRIVLGSSDGINELAEMLYD